MCGVPLADAWKGVVLRDGVGSTGGDLLAGLALPDADSLPLDSGLSAECACVTIRGYQSMLLSIVVRFGL
jgi:hypothetical protein